MTLKERFKAAYWTAIIGFGISVTSIIGFTIILLRMNNQQCVPETGLWEFYEMNLQIFRVVIFFAFGFIWTFVSDILDKINIKTWNSPDWLKNILRFIGICFFSASVIVALIALIYHLFIKVPC